jgi:hypothetical protein
VDKETKSEIVGRWRTRGVPNRMVYVTVDSAPDSGSLLEECNNLSLAVMKLLDTKRAWKNRKKKAGTRVKDRPVRSDIGSA